MIKVCNQFAMIIDFSYLHNIDIIKTNNIIIKVKLIVDINDITLTNV